MTDLTAADRRRARQREHLIDTALDLFEARGYDGVSVDEIAAAGDISPRTFFRYFDTKASLIGGELNSGLATIGDKVRERPPDEPIDIALCEGAVDHIGDLSRSTRFLRCVRLMIHTPTLQAGMVRGTLLETILRDAVVARHPELSPLEASVSAAIGAALLRQPIAALGGGADPDASIAHLRAAFDAARRVW